MAPPQNEHPLQGLWVPLITPFDAADSVDLDGLERLTRRVLLDGAAGVVALGTTGEPAVLTNDEQRRVVETCAAVCAELNAPLMVGAGTNSTRTTIETLERLCGHDAVTSALVVVPYYTRASEAGIVEHYRQVASASPVPIVAYNVPYRTGRGLDAANLLEVANLDGVIGLKQSVGALDGDTLAVLRDAPCDFAVLSGEDSLIVPMMLMGARGAITASAHVCTTLFAAAVDAALAGDWRRAVALAERVLPVVGAGFVEPNPAVFKGALAASGEIASAELRSPMTAASNGAVDGLLAAIAAASTGG